MRMGYAAFVPAPAMPTRTLAWLPDWDILSMDLRHLGRPLGAL